VLGRLRKSRDFRLRVIGAPDYHLPDIETEALAWRASTEVDDLKEIDIGIMPLPEDAWTHLRTHLKVRQYMGLGIPCVVSPVGVNTEVVEEGRNGFLARTPDEWIDKLTRLIDDASLRQRIGAAGRRTIVERYSARIWAPRVLEIIRQAAAGRSPVAPAPGAARARSHVERGQTSSERSGESPTDR
jgi:glycosyltransferase involved in cell wall biosynthesis